MPYYRAKAIWTLKTALNHRIFIRVVFRLMSLLSNRVNWNCDNINSNENGQKISPSAAKQSTEKEMLSQKLPIEQIEQKIGALDLS